MLQRKTRVLFVLVLMLGLPAVLLGQAAVSGSLTGKITDEAGALIPNAEVILTNEATGVKFVSRTNEAGSYTFTNLSPGHYTLSAQMTGFSPVEVSGLTVTVAQFARADIQMKVGVVSERSK